MPYEYLEDAVTADVTFHAWADDLSTLFREAGDATMNVMIASLGSIRALTHRSAAVAADSLDLLLLRFLEELIFHKDAERLLLRATDVRVDLSTQSLEASLAGEVIDATRHELLADVKAVTLYGLKVEPTHDGWQASVTLDV